MNICIILIFTLTCNQYRIAWQFKTCLDHSDTDFFKAILWGADLFVLVSVLQVMKMIIAIYKRGESVFKQRLHREHNYKAVTSIITWPWHSYKVLQWMFQIQKEPLAPHSRLALWKVIGKFSWLPAYHHFPLCPLSLNLDKHGCQEAWIMWPWFNHFPPELDFSPLKWVVGGNNL